MIHVVIGTKAQLVKLAPVLSALQVRKVPYNFIFTGQHHETMDALRENFKLPPPNVTLHSGKDITSIPSMLVWLIKILWQTLFNLSVTTSMVPFWYMATLSPLYLVP